MVRSITLLLVVAAALCFSTVSWAGTMTLYSCHTPSGRAVSADAWKPSGNPGYVSDDCATRGSGSLSANFGVTPEDDRGWTLTAASGTAITSFEVRACGQIGGTEDASLVFSQRSDDAENRLAFTAAPRSAIGCVGSRPWYANAGNVVRGGGESVRSVSAVASCRRSCESNVILEISSFRAEISDFSPPGGVAVSGSLSTSAVQTGAEQLTFSAKDEGVGVYRAVVEAQINRAGDWREIVSAPVRPGTECTPVRETAKLYEFASAAPCPTTVSSSLTLEKGALPVGLHDLRVRLEDAAGNSSMLVGARPYEVPGPPNTLAPVTVDEPETIAPSPLGAVTPAAAPAAPPSTARISITAPRVRKLASARAFEIAGVLVDLAGTPIPRAVISVQTRAFLPKPATAAGPWSRLGDAVTDEKGRFHAAVPAGPSRTVLASYATPGLSDAVATADVTAPASITVRAVSTRVRNGNSVVFRGQLAGPVPNAGVPVSLEVHDPTRWIPVATTQRRVRTASSGKFTLTYRFLRTFESTKYRFRVIADEDSAFPYRRGTSRPITIHVRP